MLIDWTLLIVGVVLLVPIGVFAVECGLAVFPARRRSAPDSGARPKVAVLVPAHDEQAGIGRMLACLGAGLEEGDRIVVVADNCVDHTAKIAREHGAIVLERFDAVRRGKPHALRYGLRFLQNDPPDIVVVLDADCEVAPDTVDRLARLAAASGRPVQALNLQRTASDAGTREQLSSLGMYFANLVRPTGLARLGLPCGLMGTGMALPWSVVRLAPAPTGSVVEDLELGIELTLAGHAPLFCPDASVISAPPREESAFLSQRTRWEHGRLHTIRTHFPKLVRAALAQRRPELLWMALDLTVPPLALLVAVWSVTFAASALAAALGRSLLPLVLVGAGCIPLAASILLGWAVYCRRAIPLRAFLGVPRYVLRKLPIYFAFFGGRRQREWVRTRRDAQSDPPPVRLVVEDPAYRLESRRTPASSTSAASTSEPKNETDGTMCTLRANSR
jgi:cellulose synthase/poly-beta-1,6-N-acetylglucosamine synthase-like glycosyltransferase